MEGKREVRSFLMARDPSIDRRFRPRPEKQVRLFNEIEEEDIDLCEESTDEEEGEETYATTDSSSATTSVGEKTTASNSGAEDAALVYLRLRPVERPSTSYTISGNTLITGPPVETASTSNNKNIMEKHYNFSNIFEGSTQQKDVYEKCIGNKIEMDENFTILTYGTSGSGKTFTLLGDEHRPGIIPRSLENIFTRHHSNIYPHPSVKLDRARPKIMDDLEMAHELQIRKQLLGASTEIPLEHARLQHIIQAEHSFETKAQLDVSVMIWMSFVEIYNENVYDLLAPPPSNQNSMTVPPRSNLRVVSNEGKVFVKGLTSVYVKSSLETLKLLHYGRQRANYASTSINENSSRSHCILIVDILKYSPDGTITETSYKFCDLAGSERLDKTGNVGSRLKEAQRINTSLLVLGRCLDAANNNTKKKNNDLIPVRESKLTMLLQSALLGKEKLTMVVNVTPTDAYYEENLNVLCFASIAKNIKFKRPIVKQMKSRFSLVKPPMQQNDPYMEQLLEENLLLRSEVARLQEEHCRELQQQEHELRNELVDSFEKTLQTNKDHFAWVLQTELDCQKRKYENMIAKLKRQHEEELEDLQEELEELQKELEQAKGDKENANPNEKDSDGKQAADKDDEGEGPTRSKRRLTQ